MDNIIFLLQYNLRSNPVATQGKKHEKTDKKSKTKKPHRHLEKSMSMRLIGGPSDWNRTSGLLNPIQARYQSAPHPDNKITGAVDRNRTGDLHITSVLLYLLSYNSLPQIIIYYLLSAVK